MKKTKNITKEEFLNSTIDKISQVYKGKRNCCRCGCGGDYTSTSFMKNPRSVVDDIRVEEYLQKAKRLVNKGNSVDFYDTCVDVKVGQHSSLTFYFDEL